LFIFVFIKNNIMSDVQATSINDLGNSPAEGTLPPEIPQQANVQIPAPIPQGEQKQGPVPPPQIPQAPQQVGQPQLVQNVMNDYQQINGQQVYYDQNNQPFVIQEEYPESQTTISLKDNLWNTLKLPLLVVILVFIASDGLLNNILVKIPKLGTSVGTLNYFGKLIQALLFGGVFFLSQQYI
jgi:RNAse (barnase) inhibitor barstar